MKISNRELGLGWATVITLILGATYLFALPGAQEWKDAKRARDLLNRRAKSARELLAGKDEVNQRLEVLRKQLPQHPEGKDVTAELLRMLERLAQQHNLVLLRREPDKEKSVGDLYEVAINCSWEGELDAIVHFLYALQVQGAILDIRQLTMSPIPGGTVRLKGNFTVDCAYTRAAAAETPAPAAAPAPAGEGS